jgi:hypothetical protein
MKNLTWKAKRHIIRTEAREKRLDLLLKRIKTISPLDLSYLAGLVDGEGCIFVGRGNTKRSKKSSKRGLVYHSGLAIAMTDLSLLKWARRTVGFGKIRAYKAKEGCKQAWRWTIWSNQAAALLSILSPYLKLKVRQAKNLLNFQATMKYVGFRGRNGATESDWSNREKYYQISSRLNKRGV